MTNFCFGKTQRFLLLLSFSLFTLIVQAQTTFNTTNWRYSNPRQFGFTILDLDFFDDNRGIAVGAGGLSYTRDGGKSWIYGPLTYVNAAGQVTVTTLNDVHFITSGTAYVVGNSGMMAKTTDGGATWSFVTTPLFNNSRNINAVWFVNENTGYIGGQWNTSDSIPKLYVTRNGGASWDSISAPIGGKTRVGYINNPNLAPIDLDINAKGKEIFRIEFLDESTGYVSGSGSSIFIPITRANANCTAATTTVTTGSNNASLLWKVKNGVLTDYSLSKERLGYTGINNNTIACTTLYGTITPQSQQFRAMNIINDSTVVLMSFNNNVVVKVMTGVNDSTRNINLPSAFEKGRYQLLNFPFPPTQGPQAGPSIPSPQVLNASNPYVIVRAANGKLFATSGSSTFAPENRIWTSIDTGRNWVQERSLPTGENFSTFTTWVLEITPTGRFVAGGDNGVVSDSIPGGRWASTYKTNPVALTSVDIDFPDCDNGIAVGGASITVTEDGGKTWQDKRRADFANLNISITGISYVSPGRAYLTTNAGTLYITTDKGTTLDPLYANANLQIDDVAAIGNDTIWAVAYSAFSVPAANRTSSVLRSVDGGATWQQVGGFPVGTTSPRISRMSFANRQVGYIAGSRNAVYKTTDGGVTWTNISPFPSLNNAPTGFASAFVTYQEIQALDENTVVVIGNMFTNTGVRRVYKTTDGGATWQDITGNIATDSPGNIVGLRMHDGNNGYVTSGNNLFKTTNGGATWVKDIAPATNIFETLGFAPSKVAPSVAMENRLLFVTGISVPRANGTMMEYGDTTLLNVTSSVTVTNASCTNPNGGSITVTANGGIRPYSYSINGVTYQPSNVFSGLTQGARTVYIRDAYCNLDSLPAQVGFINNLTVAVSPADTSVCSGAPVPLRATATQGASFAWAPASNLSAANISNPVATPTAPVQYTVTATLNGCTATATATVGIRPNPFVTAGEDKTILAGTSVMLNGNGDRTNTTSIQWAPNVNVTGGNTFTPVVKPANTTTYTITVRNRDNCTSTDQATVTVIPYCAKVMKAFTPNGDGVNDRWVVTDGTACVTRVAVTVFNRSGIIVYKNDNYQNDWDGTFKGKAIPDGTYYYSVSYYLISGTVSLLTGDVTILR